MLFMYCASRIRSLSSAEQAGWLNLNCNYYYLSPLRVVCRPLANARTVEAANSNAAVNDQCRVIRGSDITYPNRTQKRTLIDRYDTHSTVDIRMAA